MKLPVLQVLTAYFVVNLANLRILKDIKIFLNQVFHDITFGSHQSSYI